MSRLLVVRRPGSEPFAHTSHFATAGFSARVVEGAAEARAAAAQWRYATLLWDLRGATTNDAQTMTLVALAAPTAQVLAVTAAERPDLSLAALRAGADDYLTWPVPVHELVHRLRALVERAAGRAELARLRDQLEDPAAGGPFGVVGRSEAIVSALQAVRALAPEPWPVLLTGPAGSGKSLVARALHEAGRRRGPRVTVTCGAVRWEQAADLLFGGVEDEAEPSVGDGAIARAAGGTLVMEDVDALPLFVQRRLCQTLRASTGPAAIVRLIVTSRVDLDAAVERGTFDHELLAEVAPLRIALSPLAARGEDVVLLAEHFVARAALARGKQCALGPAAVSCLRAYSWPGNVGQLLHAMEAAMALCPGGTIEPHHLPRGLCHSDRDRCEVLFSLHLSDRERVPLGEVLQGVEQELLGWAMRKAGGKQTTAASLLGIPRTTLQSRLARLP